MMRVNVIIGEKQTTKSFFHLPEVRDYLIELNIPSSDIQDIAKNIWSLNVGTSYIYTNMIFACAGKTRVANHLRF